uniref:Uncharacterized protein n=1 Tax=Mola mola TaxID=94237 RepID=A0A3Q3VWV7_MOLML
MDSEVSVLLHCAAWKGLRESQVQLYGNICPPLDKHEPWLFNGSKFRLHSFFLSGPLLTLKLGLTCYKDYLGTNWSCRAAELCQLGEAKFGDRLALLAQPLGVGGILCTDDDRVVLIRRSMRVAEAGGLLDIPGGHPEPKVNIPLSSLREPILMGVALNHISAGRPSAEFYVGCSLTSDQVRELYRKGGAEANESTDIVFLSREEVLQLDGCSPVWSELCPSAKGAMLLYQTVKPDGEHSQNQGHNNHPIAAEDGPT